MKLSNILIVIDKTADYVPIVSSITNLVDLFQKCIIHLGIKQKTVSNSHYYTHINSKKAVRCVILLIPVIGNVSIGIFDYKNNKYKNNKKSQKQKKREIIEVVTKNGLALEYASKELRNDQDVVMAAVKQDGRALGYASKELRNVLIEVEVVIEDDYALGYASDDLRKDEK